MQRRPCQPHLPEPSASIPRPHHLAVELAWCPQTAQSFVVAPSAWRTTGYGYCAQAVCPFCDAYGRTVDDPAYDPRQPQTHGVIVEWHCLPREFAPGSNNH